MTVPHCVFVHPVHAARRRSDDVIKMAAKPDVAGVTRAVQFRRAETAGRNQNVQLPGHAHILALWIFTLWVTPLIDTTRHVCIVEKMDRIRETKRRKQKKKNNYGNTRKSKGNLRHEILAHVR